MAGICWFFFCFMLAFAYGGVVLPTDDLAARISNATPNEVFTLIAGDYNLSSPMVVQNSFTLEGVGEDTVIYPTNNTGAAAGFHAVNYNIELKNLQVSGCYEGFNVTNGSVRLTHVLWQYSGAIVVRKSQLVTVTSCEIKNNLGDTGAGVFLEDVYNFTTTDSTYGYNNGIMCGAICVSRANFTINNCTIQTNTADLDNGGGVCVLEGASGAIHESTISDNAAGLHGGGITVQGGNVTITNSTIDSNSARNGGGIFLLDQLSSATLVGVTCTQNHALLGGGCIYANSNTYSKVIDSQIVNNKAEESAGGLSVNGNFFIYNCNITENTVVDSYFGKGGGIYVDPRTNVVEVGFSLITQNHALSGSGIYLDNLRTGLFANNTIIDNYEGEDLYIFPVPTSTMQILNTQVQFGGSAQALYLCCGNSSYQAPYPTNLLCSYPVCENCVNGCNCPTPKQPITDAGTAYASVDTTCTYESCDATMAQTCDANAFCIKFPDHVTYKCTCNSGYSGNGTYCEDINECNSSTSPCPVYSDCFNTIGNFTCTCQPGLVQNRTGCADIDECDPRNNNTCSPNATCSNTFGGYTCSCQSGYEGDGTVCSDINECTRGTYPCPSSATCTNTEGDFYCTCSVGYSGNGTHCTDVDECAVGFNNGCSALENCVNSIGSYQCECLEGYARNGLVCEDINECANGTSPCQQHAICHNMIGSYTCNCSDGFFAKKNGDPCAEIVYADELSIGLGVIVGVCILLGIFAALLLATNWDLFTRVYGSFYCAIVIAGVFSAEISALTQLPKPKDSLCVAFPWLLGIGFTLVYGCLFIKTWMLLRIWNQAMKLKRVSITAFTVVQYVGVSLCVEIAFLILWTVVDPPKAQLVSVVGDKYQWRCASKTRVFWAVFLTLKGLWLLLGAGIVVITRKVLKQYKEFTSIGYAVYNNLILMAIAIPLALLLWDVPSGSLVITVIVIVLAFTFTLFILFFDAWAQILFPRFSDISLESVPSTPSSNSDIGSAHETVAHDTNVEAE